MSDEIQKDIKQKLKVDKDTAEFEFERFCEEWEISFDESTFNEEEKNDYEKLKSTFINAVQKGRLCIQDDGTLKYTISKFSKDNAGKELIIEMPDGKDYLAMDIKDGQWKDVHKNFSMLASVIGKPPQFISKLKSIDIDALMSVIRLFLAR